MAWIILTEALVLGKLAGPELAALKTKALAVGQDNPLPDVIDQVTREVRGYVKANANNLLDANPYSIPDELTTATLNRVRFELATRLPVSSLLTEDRRQANRDAIAMFRDVAAGRFTIQQPGNVSTEQSAGPAVKRVSHERQRFSRERLRGF